MTLRNVILLAPSGLVLFAKEYGQAVAQPRLLGSLLTAMTEFATQNGAMGVKEELIDDAMDSAFAGIDFSGMLSPLPPAPSPPGARAPHTSSPQPRSPTTARTAVSPRGASYAMQANAT